jgi:MAE_28990/MAE_18760-like HEPN
MYSAEDLEEVLAADLSWRKKELLMVKIQARAAPDWAIPMHVRSGITMLYAHWEGFVKAAGEALVEFVRDQRLKMGELAPGYLAIALRKELAGVRDSKSGAIYPEMSVSRAVVDGYERVATLKPSGSIPTASNLSWKQFAMVATRLGVDVSELQLLEHLIDVRLVGNRNTIAHGDRTSPMTREEFLELHAKVVALLDRVSYQILRVAESGQYRR